MSFEVNWNTFWLCQKPDGFLVICMDGMVVHVSVYTIGCYMYDMALTGCALAMVHGYVDVAKLQISVCHCFL